MKTLKILIMALLCLLGLTQEEYYYNSYIKSIENEINIMEDKVPDINKIIEYSLINENLTNLLNKYSDLKNIIEEANIRIPKDDKFIPQGIALMNNYILITGYYENGKNSQCYVLNKKGEIINIVELDTNSHVGSIAYDKINNLIWVPDNEGILNAYSSNEFLENDKVKAKYRFNNVSENLIDFEDDSKNLIAYLYVDDNNIYIGNFFIDEVCIIKKYVITVQNDKIKLKFINSFKVPSRIQSITFIEKNNKKYMLLSKSYRRRNPSYIYVYEYNETIKDYSNLEIGKLKLPPMLEQINVDKNQLYLLFESNAKKYWNCPEKIEFLLVGNINKIFQ